MTPRLQSPTKEQVRAARKKLAMTKTECAAIVSSDYARWYEWEAGIHRMNARTWALFLERTGLKE